MAKQKEAWDKLSMQEKAQLIKLSVDNGVSSLKQIRDTYNLYSSGGNLVHKYGGEQVGESQYLQKQDNTNVSNLPTIEPIPVPEDMQLTEQQLAELNHAKALYENEGLNIVSPEFDLLTLFRGFATEPLKIFKTQSNTSSKALKDNSGLIKLQKSVKGHYPDNYNYEAANQLLQKLKEEGYNLDGIDVDKLIQARVENLIDANQNGRLLLHNNDGLITAHDIGKIDDLDSDIYYAMTNFIDKKEGLGNIGKIQYFKDKDGSYHIKMIRSDKPNTQIGRDLYDAIEEAAIQNGVDNTIVAETLLQPEKTVHTMETWFPNREIVSNKGRWDLLNDITGDRTSTGGMPVWKLYKERPSNLKSLIFDPSIVDENGIMHLGEGMYHSTGGPLYPFSFEKNPFLKTPVVRYDEGGFFARLFGKKDTPPTPEEIKAARVERFVNDTWETEYSIPRGYDPTTGLFYPYKSPEGGTKTIGPGFKLRADGSGDATMFSAKEAAKGVTREQINEKLRAQGELQYDKVLEFLNQKGNRLPIDTINPNIMNGLMDLRFQVGALGGWDNLREAVLNGDLESIKKESLVTFKDGDTGKIKPDVRRNELRAKKFWHYD